MHDAMLGSSAKVTIDLLILSREYGNSLYRVYTVIIFHYSLLTLDPTI